MSSRISFAVCWILIAISNWECQIWIYITLLEHNIIARTKKDVVASLTRWKICWTFDPYASWSSICVASDLSARSSNSFISSTRTLDGDTFHIISFGAWKTTYDLKFSIASLAAFGTPFIIVLSTARSRFAVSSRHLESSSLLLPTAWYNNSQPVTKIQRQLRTSFISMITLATEKATFTGLVSIQPGTLLRSVCTNRDATPRPSFVTAFQSVTCVWEFGPAIVEVRLVVRSSSKRLRVFQLTLTDGGVQQIWITRWRKFCRRERGGSTGRNWRVG